MLIQESLIRESKKKIEYALCSKKRNFFCFTGGWVGVQFQLDNGITDMWLCEFKHIFHMVTVLLFMFQQKGTSQWIWISKWGNTGFCKVQPKQISAANKAAKSSTHLLVFWSTFTLDKPLLRPLITTPWDEGNARWLFVSN